MKTAALFIVMLAILAPVAGADDVKVVPPYDQFIVIPLRVHVLTSKALDIADSKMTDDEAAKTVPQINEIWHKAGIHFALESVVREQATNIERYKEFTDHAADASEKFAYMPYLLPSVSRTFDGLHVYYVGNIPMNGGHIIPADVTIVNSNPKLREVEGGTKNWVARVTGRALGLGLGLDGRPDDVGLLSSGTNGVGLNRGEINRARKVAKTIPGALDVKAASTEAEKAQKNGDMARARRHLTALAEIPGEGAAAAKKRLAELPSGKP